MPLSWNEIRANAMRFSRDFADETREDAEAKSFWDEFFAVFGIKRRVIASFEEPVKKLSGKYGFIDLFWRSVLLVEHKSGGKDLNKAASQAFQYIQDLVNNGRQDESPRYVLLSNFQEFLLFDLDDGSEYKFSLADFHKHVDKFAFIPGYKQHSLSPQDPINLKAVEIMGRLHDKLEAGGYKGHELERMLVRVLFCLFAEDTGIFTRNAFQYYIENHTAPDGSNLGAALSQFFYVLNTSEDKRQTNLLEELAELPYVNGELFSENLGFAAFNREMREELLTCTRLDWSRISPAVFGALFQSVMDPAERRQVGAHYTSERDILKVIGPLFLDGLKEELEAAGNNERKLKTLQSKMAGLKLLDPACGCGNFLVVAYRELRLLELEIIKRLNSKISQMLIESDIASKIDVDQFYGIEIDEWPARIAEVAMWLMDHQMNLRLSQEFGNYFVRLPLKKSPRIVCANALRIDWNDVLPAKSCSYVFGNPPFVGAKWQSKDQRSDMALVCGSMRNKGLLDYVAGWYVKSTPYLKVAGTNAAFVSTNSITQGEQVGVLWPELFRQGVAIKFAHRTFAWTSDARGAAHVHVVVIGFGLEQSKNSLFIFDYDNIKGDPIKLHVSRISPYLVEGSQVTILNRNRPLCNVPQMVSGNKPIDGGNYLFTPEEKEAFLVLEPNSAVLFKRWLGGKEFLQAIERYYLDLTKSDPSTLKGMPLVLERIKRVREFRLKSSSSPTRKLAETPTAFHTRFESREKYLAMPEVSSERRHFIPLAFLSTDVLCGNKLRLIANSSLFHFGVICSTQHMAWVRTVSGRLKSDFQYSIKLVYNNFPWPQNAEDKQREAVELKAQSVLNVRDQFPKASLSDLYDPLSMPKALVKAHQELDQAVDKCYRSQPFTSERQRVEYLFKLYEELTKPLVSAPKPAERPRKKKE